ncbi:SMI1/KNR4 family protein [Mucilaginibacter sp. NFX135]|uniref:SMI1/KNR4 family protein n=1 Tax=Mucilaginibacter sp. NFX135 TaxID=3402687 RepID=UPI003AFB7E6C
MDDKYTVFFDEVKKIILGLGIETRKDVEGCTKNEIIEIESKFGKLPLAYKAYLKSFGRNFLFSFFDGEQFSYDDYDDISEFVSDTFERENFEITRPFMPISHYRYDYFRFIYLDEIQNENPKVWIYVPYAQKDEENPQTTGNRFTDIILSFFRGTLMNHTASFHWVSPDEKSMNENIVQDRYKDWARKIISVIDYINAVANINSSSTENEFVKDIHKTLQSYFELQEESIKKLAKGES